ncbi:Na+-transporting methylmalonyl-CoA/oxaloacetate decarboxylase gamma subunit [Lachnospiraceae bacterium PF1-21]
MNKKRKSILTRAMSLVAVIVMLITMITPMGVVAKEKTPEEVLQESLVKKKGRSAGDTVSYVIGEQINYGGAFTNVFGGTVNGNYGEVYCMNPLKVAPAGGSYAISYLDNSSALAKAMYYLFGGPGFVRDALIGGTDNDMRIATHMTVAYILDPNGDWSHGVSGGLLDGVKMVAENITNVQPAAPSSFRAYVFNMNQGTQAMIGSYNIPQGKLQIAKTSANPSITDGNACYTKAGAKFSVFKKGTNDVVGELITAADGKSNVLTLDAGGYEIQETQAPKGYILPDNPPRYSVTIVSDQLNDYYVSNPIVNTPGNDPISMIIGKLDAESGKNESQGAAKLSDGEFTVWYYDGKYQSEAELANANAVPKRTWILKTNELGRAYLLDDYKIGGDDFYYVDVLGTLEPTVPWGTLVSQETKAPEGYLLEDASGNAPPKHFMIIDHDNTGHKIKEYNPPEQPDQIIRGDFDLTKIFDETGKRGADIKWKITSDEDGEEGFFTTDQNAYYSSAADYVAHDAENGLWFGEKSALDNSKGALVYGTYTIDEQRCEANEGYKLLTGIKLVISRDGYTVHMGTLTNDKYAAPEIGTKFFEVDTEKQEVLNDGVKNLVDVVAHKNVNLENKDAKFEMRLTVMVKPEKENEEPKVLQQEGKDVKASTPLTVEDLEKGDDVKVPVSIDTSSLGGKKLVAYEQLVDVTDPENEVIVVSEEDINNPNQTISVTEPKKEVVKTTKPENVQTNDTLPIVGVVSVLLGLTILAVVVAIKKRKRL